MGKFAVGSVVLVTFPFSNLKGKKIRPALILAQAEFNNLILCQITSKPYASKTAIQIRNSDFSEGSLPIVSFLRPDKIFTADTSIIKNEVGHLTPKVINLVLQRVRKIFTLS